MALPSAGEVWWVRVRRALRAEAVGGERESRRILRAIDERGGELARRRELADGSLDHPTIVPLFDELGEVLGVGPLPRP